MMSNVRKSRHANCAEPTTSIMSNARQSRHVTFAEPGRSSQRNMPVSIPVSLTPTPAGIMIEVRKVTTVVTELQKDMAVLKKDIAAESAARKNMQEVVEKLVTENDESKKQKRTNPTNPMQMFMKLVPCKTLLELDELLAFIENEEKFVPLTEYIKLLGGRDFNEAIKRTFNVLMYKSVLKQLSWTGCRTTKPSLQSKYKIILDCIHVAMSDKFKDYTVASGEAKIRSLL